MKQHSKPNKKLLASSIVVMCFIGILTISHAAVPHIVDCVKRDGIYYEIKDDNDTLSAYVEDNNRWCTLTDVKIPDSINYSNTDVEVRGINAIVFSSNEVIRTLTLGANIEIIKESAFYDCTNLNKITLNEGIKELESTCFFRTKIKNVYIPSSVKFISAGAFAYNLALKTINVSNSNTSYKSKDRILYNYDENTLISYPLARPNHSFVLTENINFVKEYAFWGANNLKEITVYNCTLNMSNFNLNKKIKITCYEGSTAHNYAKDKGYEYTLIHENHAPKLIKPIPDITIKVGETLNYNVKSHFNDEGGDNLKYSILTLNSSISFNIYTKSLNYRLKVSDKHSVTIIAEDGNGEKAKDTFMITSTNALDLIVFNALDVTNSALIIALSTNQDCNYSILVKETSDNLATKRSNYYVTGKLLANTPSKIALSVDRFKKSLKPNTSYDVIVTLKNNDHTITGSLSLSTKENTPIDYILSLDNIPTGG